MTFRLCNETSKVWHFSSLNFFLYCMQAETAKNSYELGREDVLWTTSIKIFLHGSLFDIDTSAIGMMQTFSKKTAIACNAAAKVASLFHIVFQNYSRRFRCFVIKYWNTVATLLSVSTSEIFYNKDNEKRNNSKDSFIFHIAIQLFNNVWFTQMEVAITVNMFVIYIVTRRILSPITNQDLNGIRLRLDRKQWTCHPPVTSYSWNTHEEKHMSGTKHCDMLQLRVRCLIRKCEIESIEQGCSEKEGKMDQIYSVSENILRQCSSLLKQKKLHKAFGKKQMVVPTIFGYTLSQ